MVKYKKLIVYGCLVILFIPFMMNLRFLVEVNEIITPEFESYSGHSRLMEEFVAHRNLYIILYPKNKMTHQSICILKNWWRKELRENKEIESSFASFEALKVSFNKSESRFESTSLVPYDCELGEEPLNLSGLRKSSLSSILIPKNKDAVVLSFSFYPYEERGLFGYFNNKALSSFIDSVRSSAEFKEYRVLFGGIAYYFHYLIKGYIDSIFLNTISVLALCVFVGFLFKSFITGILFYIIYNLVSLPVFVFMGMVGINIDTLTNTLPLMILLATLQDFIWVCSVEDSSVRFSKYRLAGLFTSLTTAFGFYSLYFSDLSVIRNFGLATGFSALVEYFVVYYVFKEVAQFSFFKKWRPKIRKMPKIASVRIPRAIAIIVIALPIISLSFISRVSFLDYPEKIFPKNHPVPTNTNLFLKDFGWISQVNLIYPSKYAEKIRLDHIPKLLEDDLVYTIEDLGKLSGDFESDFVSKQLMEQYLSSSGYSEKLKVGNLNRAILYLNSSKNTKVTNLWDKAKELCGGNCFLAGDLISYTEFSQKVSFGFYKSSLVSFFLVLITLLLIGLYRKSKSLTYLLITSLWGPLVLLMFFIVTQLPVFFVTSIVISIVMGLAGDNAVLFLLGDSNASSTGNAKALASLSFSVTLGYLLVLLLLQFSPFGALRQLSWLLISGLSLSLFGDIVLFLSLHKDREI